MNDFFLKVAKSNNKNRYTSGCGLEACETSQNYQQTNSVIEKETELSTDKIPFQMPSKMSHDIHGLQFVKIITVIFSCYLVSFYIWIKLHMFRV